MAGDPRLLGARLHAVVQGRVQGVNFRRFIAEHARRLGLSGSVRNLEDGESVEIVAEGTRAALERLLELARQGPPHAAVERVELTWLEAEGTPPGFRVLG